MSTTAGPRRLRLLFDAVLSAASEHDLAAMMQGLVESAASLTDATFGALALLDEAGEKLVQFAVVGMDEETHRAIGDLPEGKGLLGLLIVGAQPLRLPDLTAHPDSFGFPPHHPPMRSFLGVPILLRDQVIGNIYVGDKRSADAFTEIDEELLMSLAGAASVAIENDRMRCRLGELAVVEERDRIARDLHDTVIQRLFATGLSLQGATRLFHTDPAAAVDRVEAAVGELDLTVKHIRTAIFGLGLSRGGTAGLREKVLDLMGESAGPLGFEPRILFDGPVDSGVDDGVGLELLATLREALSNIARHARASRVDVEILVEDDLCLRVIDDGVGPPEPGAPRGLGLGNMAARAEKLGGSLEIRAADPSGAVLVWRVPRA